jgi:hypothetical protein
MIFEGSRYANDTAFVDEDIDIMYLAFPDTYIPSSIEDTIYKFVAGDRIDLLAERFYGDSSLGWIIMYANPQYFTEFDIQLGDLLNIPSRERAERYVNGSE